MATLRDQVLRTLSAASGPLDDDVLAQRLGAKNRQHVNQVCRRLELEGKIRRTVGAEGKLVNVLREDDTVVPSPAPSTQPPPTPTDVISEDEVKRAVEAHLVAAGYIVRVAWGRSPGVDIDARHGDHRYLLEAKGQVLTPGAQQANYFLGALGELVQRMSDPGASYGLALPDVAQYRGLVDRLPALAWTRLNFVAFFVGRDGEQLVVRVQDQPSL